VTHHGLRVSSDVPLLSARGLRKSFGKVRVLNDLDLDLSAGDVLLVTGGNGAGKSTLLECLSGAQPLDAGELLLAGRPSNPRKRGYWRSVHGILDDFAWFPDLSIIDHLRLLDPTLTRAEVLAHLDRLCVAPLVDRLPLTLSAGQRQRCALIAAAVREWRVLCVDEPERHLDTSGVKLLARFLHEQATDRALVIATHDDHLRDMPGVRHLHLEDESAAVST